MSDSGPFGEDDPFMNNPMFKDLAKMLGGQGSLSWDAARQLATMGATGGESEPNPDPSDRIRIEQLSRVAELQVAQATGLPAVGVVAIPVTRTRWVDNALAAWKPRFDHLSKRLVNTSDDADTDDEATDMMAMFTKMIGPTMLGMSAGSMIGQMAQHSLGAYDLPIAQAGGVTELGLVMTNLNEFRDAWNIDPDDLALWICVHEMTHHAVLSIPHVRDRLDSLLSDYLDAFEPSGGELERRLGELGGDMSALNDIQALFSDPEVLLGAIRTPAQNTILPHITSICSVIVGYVDLIIDRLSGSLIGEGRQISEAIRRRRVEVRPSDRFVERLFGLELGQESYDAGRRFVDGVESIGGSDALGSLWSDADNLPTPNELATPGVWVARVGLEAHLPDEIEATLADVEIPDDLSDL